MTGRGIFALLTALLIVFGSASLAAADQDSVLQIVAVRVNPGKLDNYLERIEKLQAISDRLQAGGTLRVWRATLAGDNAGTIVVGIEYSSLAAFAENSSKVEADAEWQKAISRLDSIRTIVGRSLYREITP